MLIFGGAVKRRGCDVFHHRVKRVEGINRAPTGDKASWIFENFCLLGTGIFIPIPERGCIGAILRKKGYNIDTPQCRRLQQTIGTTQFPMRKAKQSDILREEERVTPLGGENNSTPSPPSLSRKGGVVNGKTTKASNR